MNAQLNRRHFLWTASAGMALATVGSRLAFAAAEGQQAVGVQLYTLREMMAESVAETLQKVAEIGYRNVEFAGYFDHSPAAIRAMLDEAGLRAPAMHVSLDLLESNLDALIDTAAAIGHDYMVMPFLLPNQRKSIDDYHRLADNMNRWGERCKAANIRLGYHNHHFEFMPLDGVEPYDVLLKETDNDKVFFELDLYWAKRVGKDPLEYFKANPGRFPLWHLKDITEEGGMADVGHGVLDFARLFEAADIAGYRFGFVEHDSTKAPLETIRNGFETLQKLGQV